MASASVSVNSPAAESASPSLLIGQASPDTAAHSAQNSAAAQAPELDPQHVAAPELDEVVDYVQDGDDDLDYSHVEQTEASLHQGALQSSASVRTLRAL